MSVPPLRLLIVDDNPADARLVELTLGQEAPGAYRVERAGRIADALDRFDAEPVAAVLLDLGLPDSRGTDGLRRLRARAPEVPVVVLSGAEDPEIARAAYSAGAQDYQVKGIFPPGELDRRLRAAIAAQRLEEGLRAGHPPDPAELAALARAGEGAAVLYGPGGAIENERFAPFAGGPAGTSTPGTAWLTDLLREVDETRPAVHGWLPVDRPPGLPILVEYLVRRIVPGSRHSPTVVRLHCRSGARAEAPRAPPDASAYPAGALDDGVLAQLAELGGAHPGFVSEMLATFFREAHAIAQRLAAAALRNDLPAIARDAHTLKSAAAQVGALRLSRLAADLERRATAWDGDAAQAGVREVALELGRVETDPRAERPRSGR
ncbi:MAG TPA: response regulator [Thermoplasmata archaeon]|nr:response regulator [Thermoplasmata archaeon]